MVIAEMKMMLFTVQQQWPAEQKTNERLLNFLCGQFHQCRMQKSKRTWQKRNTTKSAQKIYVSFVQKTNLLLLREVYSNSIAFCHPTKPDL